MLVASPQSALYQTKRKTVAPSARGERVLSSQSALYQSKRKAVDPSANAELTRVMGELVRATKLVERYRKEARSAAKKLHTQDGELKKAKKRIVEIERSLEAHYSSKGR